MLKKEERWDEECSLEIRTILCVSDQANNSSQFQWNFFKITYNAYFWLPF